MPLRESNQDAKSEVVKKQLLSRRVGCGPMVSGWGIGENWGKYRQWEARRGPLPFAYVSVSPSAAPHAVKADS